MCSFVVVFQFALLTDCLQESIMLFVNHVAGVVHKVVHGHAGSCNKNIGEAWLVVWPLKSATDSGAVLPRGSEVEALTGGTGHTTADCAVAAFALAPLLIKGNDQIAQLSQRAELQRASPGYEISMGYGLHSGWAIEGAIGSDLKIDASYLSPNVNLASRLEAATKQYRVPLLFSSDVRALLRALAARAGSSPRRALRSDGHDGARRSACGRAGGRADVRLASGRHVSRQLDDRSTIYCRRDVRRSAARWTS